MMDSLIKKIDNLFYLSVLNKLEKINNDIIEEILLI